MPGRTSGLERDLNLVRRRAWLFIPFFLFGLLAAFALGSYAGKANAVASMQTQTTFQDSIGAGDRGLRIPAAKAMTDQPAFQKEVVDKIGDPNFDYSRFAVALGPVTEGDSYSSALISIAIRDPNRVRAEQYRQAWVDVFTKEYTAPDGMFRTQYVATKQAVATEAETAYQAAYKQLKDLAASKGIAAPLDQISLNDRTTTIVSELARQEADLQNQLAQVQGAMSVISTGKYSAAAAAAVASSMLGTPVAADAAAAALEVRAASLQAAIAAVQKLRAADSDGSFDPQFLQTLDSVRGLDGLKQSTNANLGNAAAAVVSAQTTVDTSLAFSGGLAGSLLGKVAVTLAVTLVFGLIAIYGFEWLSQVRAGVRD
jgi:hypothetical protein